MHTCICYRKTVPTFIQYQKLLYVIRSLVFRNIFLSPKRTEHFWAFLFENIVIDCFSHVNKLMIGKTCVGVWKLLPILYARGCTYKY